MILEKINKKVNLKKIIYLSSWIVELGKIARQTWVHGGWGVVVREDGQGEGRGGGLGMAWGNGRGEGGRMVVGAGRFISQLREPF